MKRSEINIKCTLTNCFSNENKLCGEFIPPIVKKLKPNDKSCPYFEDSVINLKLREQMKHKRPQYDEDLTEEQVEKIEKAKKSALANMKKKAKEKEDGFVAPKKKTSSKMNKFLE